eukprot:TRINITY_DN28532_c0_g1_i1.p1 TRINITY_DN28532_c0_g1~~TRINITY_DN28532_c0_g1_i1.p1  ORF type:complete len:614 (-),score=102.58 TRINITY_DN28532_c0_g1_i1:12-1853(-)
MDTSRSTEEGAALLKDPGRSVVRAVVDGKERDPLPRTLLAATGVFTVLAALYLNLSPLLWMKIAPMPEDNYKTLPAALTAANISYKGNTSALELSEPSLHIDNWLRPAKYQLERGLAGSNLTLSHDPMCGSACIKDSTGDPNSLGFCYFPLSSGELLSNSTMDAGCMEIVHEQVVTADTAEQCSAWCEEEVFGDMATWMFLSPTCEALTDNALRYVSNGQETYMLKRRMTWVYFSCTRARLASWAQWLFPEWFQYVLAAIYMLSGIALAYHRSTTGEDPDDVRWPEPSLQTHLYIFIPANDRQVETANLAIAGPSLLADNPLDVIILMDFACKGQAAWLALITTSLLPSVLKDPLQSRGFTELWRSFKRRLPTKGMLENTSHEGGTEAPLAGFVVLASLLFQSVHTLDWFTLVKRSVSVGSSFVLSIPSAARAEALLQQAESDPKILTDYKAFYDARKKVPVFVLYGLLARLWGLCSLAALCHWAHFKSGVALFIATAAGTCLTPHWANFRSFALTCLALGGALACFAMGLVFAGRSSELVIWYRFDLVREGSLETKAAALFQLVTVAIGVVMHIVGWGVWNFVKGENWRRGLRDEKPLTAWEATREAFRHVF